jgi:hypothetical protein
MFRHPFAANTNLYITAHDTQAGPFGYRITVPLEVDEIDALHRNYLSEIRYIADHDRNNKSR